MNHLTQERLYQLVPAIYRLRDAAEGEPLKALLSVIEREYNVLEQDIERLYHNWFIETCDEWVVPYIGDLLDVGELYANNGQNYGQQERRAYVANTLAYRRRKGTTPILEQLTQDVTGWRSRAVEFARLVSTTQSLQHLRPASATVNLRDNSPLQQVGTPFEQQAAYTVEVRPPDQGGRYNVSAMGLFIWRLQSYPMEWVLARQVKGPEQEGIGRCSSNHGIAGRYYTFNPLGHDMPLFNQPQTETTILTLAQEINVPAVLRAPMLMAELLERRQATLQGERLKGARYFDSDPVLAVFINGQRQAISPEAMVFRSLATDTSLVPAWPKWDELTNEFAASTAAADISPPIVAIDPKLGRLVFLGESPPEKVEVSYCYGFSDDIGGGPYGRDAALDLRIVSSISSEISNTHDELEQTPTFSLSWDIDQVPTSDPNPLATAICEWNQVTTAWYGFSQFTHIPIAHIQIPTLGSQDGLVTGAVAQDQANFRLNGFIVTLNVSPDAGSIIVIGAGTVTDVQGQVVLELCEAQTIDVSAYAGQTMTLFFSGISPQSGFPLDFVSSPQENGWEYFGIVPQPPVDDAPVEPGLIVIRDNGTYIGDISIQVPAAQTLKIIAADGYRPHIRGNISVQGLAPANESDQGELILNGLLIEGQLRLLPGNLKLLDIHHCTLVTEGHSLIAQPTPEAEVSDLDDGMSLIAFFLFCLSIIWRLNCQELGFGNSQSRLTLNQVAILIGHKFQLLLEHLEEAVSNYCKSCDRSQIRSRSGLFTPISTLQDREESASSPSTQPSVVFGNSRLAIHFYRTITGPIRLADTVPELLIEDCIIAKYTNPSLSINTSTLVLDAPGTATAVHTTTVFGRTQVRSLDASDSIFTEKVTTQRQQIGCLRFCYVPPASCTPRRYQCQPDQVLRANLNHIPAAITTLAIAHRADSPSSPCLFAGTVGDGLFAHSQNSDITQATGLNTWINISGDLRNRHITAILPQVSLYFDEANAQGTQVSTANPQMSYVLVGTASGQLLKALSESVTDALIDTSKPVRWRPLPLPSNNAPISLIQQDNYTISGTVRVANSGPGESFTLLGTDTYFSTDLRVGDYVTIADQQAQVQAIGRPGRGTLTSRYRTVRGQNTQFSQDLKQGDAITVQGQTRKVTKILQEFDEDNVLRINAPFDPAITTPQSYVINRDTELSVSPAITAAAEEMSLTVHLLWVGTLGEGLWRGRMDGLSWESFNQGLAHLAVTTLRRDRNHYLWIGTDGDGIFRLTADITNDQTRCDRWLAFNPGLTNGHITALSEDSQHRLWLGTQGGLFCLSPQSQTPDEADIWQPISWRTVDGANLADNLVITALVAESSNHGDHLLVSTADGKVIFLSTKDREDLIKGEALASSCSLDFRGTDVTTLLIDPEGGDRFLGTAIGTVMRSHGSIVQSSAPSESDAWISIDDGLPDVARTQELLNQIQPNFTSDRFSDPAYAQLSQACVPEIRMGAEDGSEMGVFNHLQQPQREANLRTSLDEYLRFGLQAGIFYIT